MPSLNDAYNKLVAIESDIAPVHGDLTAIKSSVDTVNASIVALTAAVQLGFSQVVQRENIMIMLLVHMIQQNDTIICNLEKITAQTCELVNLNDQILVESVLTANATTLTSEILKTVHSEAALELERLAELKKQIEQCCPPEPRQPRCVYRPCDRPKGITDGNPPNTGAKLQGDLVSILSG